MKRFPFFLAFLIFIVCVYSERSTIEWSQMTFNLAQFAARLVIILKTEVPCCHRYKTVAPFQALCTVPPLFTGAPVGAGCTQVSLSSGTATGRQCQGTQVSSWLSIFAAVVTSSFWLNCYECGVGAGKPGVAPRWSFGSAPLVQACSRQVTSSARLMQ